MPAHRVVAAFDPGIDSQACFGLGFPTAPGNELTLQRGEETLCHGVVIGIPYATHGGAREMLQ